MRGHIKKRGKNSYSIKVSLGKDGATGKYKQQWVSVKGTKKDAEKRLAELLNQLDNGMFVKPSKVTLAEYLTTWLYDYCQHNLAPSTTELYTHMAKHIIPTIGNIPLTELKPSHLQRLYADKLTSGLSGRTVQLIHVTLHKSLKNAVKTGLLAHNVAESVETPKSHRKPIHAMSESDMHLFLEFAKDTEYYSLFYLALFTGMRRGELLALRWSDIDLDLCQLSVTRNLQYLNTGTPGNRIRIGECKTTKSKRLIALSPSTVGKLREHKAKQAELRQAIGIPVTEDSLVFSHYDGSPLLPSSVTHAWIKLARRCGLTGIRLHDTRHTHASLMLKQGIHPKIVQERLGHSSIQITLDTYSHVAPGLQQAAANRFDDLLIPKHEKEPVENY